MFFTALAVTVVATIIFKVLHENNRKNIRHAIDSAHALLMDYHQESENVLKEPYHSMIEKLYNSNK